MIILSMNKMEMFFVLLLSSTSLSVRGKIVSHELKTELLKLHITHRPVLKLSNVNDIIINEITQTIADNSGNEIYCNKNYCYVVVMLTMNTSDMTAQTLFDALNDVISKEEETDFATNFKKFAKIMDFILIDVEIDVNRSNKFFVAVYYPASYDYEKIFYTAHEFDDVLRN